MIRCEEVATHAAFRALGAVLGVEVDLRYATTHNFAGRVLYEGLDCAWVRVEASNRAGMRSLQRMFGAFRGDMADFLYTVDCRSRQFSVSRAKLYQGAMTVSEKQFANDANWQRIDGVGLAGVLNKPVTPSTLLDTLSRALGREGEAPVSNSQTSRVLQAAQRQLADDGAPDATRAPRDHRASALQIEHANLLTPSGGGRRCRRALRRLGIAQAQGQRNRAEAVCRLQCARSRGSRARCHHGGEDSHARSP